MDKDQPLYLRLFPIEEVAGADLALKLKALRDAWKKDYPKHAVMPVLVPVWSTDPKAGVGNGQFAMAQLNRDGSGTPAMLQAPLHEVRTRMGILVHQDALLKLTVDEAIFFIAHEAGHYYLNHAVMAMQGANPRGMECAADQFAAHYIPQADDLLLSAAQRWQARSRAGRDPSLASLEFYAWITQHGARHPAPLDRITMMAQDAVTSLKPGSITFNERCQPHNMAEPVEPPASIRQLRQELNLPKEAGIPR